MKAPFHKSALCTVIYAKHRHNLWGEDAALTQSKCYTEFKGKGIIPISAAAEASEHLHASSFTPRHILLVARAHCTTITGKAGEDASSL